MSRIKPIFGHGQWLALAAVLGIEAVSVPAGAQPAQLALSSQIQYSQVIQGAVDPITAFVFNNAPFGASAGSYQITAAYGNGLANGFGFSYVGTQPANGGTVSSAAATFNLNTANIAPGVVPVAVTLKDTTSPGGGSITQGGQFTVLAHAAPALYFGGAPVSLSSRNVITFQTPVVAHVFGEASPTGTEAGGGAFNPEMLGDPPGEPTARLDLDSFTSFGSPNITTTLTPADNLLSTDTPGTGESFNIFVVQSPATGNYATFNTTFVVHYSDEQDLPGAAAPGSKVAAFNVNVEIEGGTADWTITTDASVPDETSTAALLATALACCAALQRPQTSKHSGRCVGNATARPCIGRTKNL